jgi:phosphoribosyl 1,2-cyclic phosphodiesterase
MEDERFVVRIWGARGSYPVPGPHTVRYGGNTTCVEVQAGEHILIIDAGTGIINLGYELLRRAQQNGGQPIIATLLLTHMHHDHTQGFPFFVPAYLGTSKLHILGPRTFDEELEETLNHSVLPPNFPVSLHEMSSLKVVRTLHGNEMILMDSEPGSLHIHNIYHSQIEHSPENVSVHIHRNPAHPRDGTYIYRIEWRGKSMVFASDTEGYIGVDQRLVNFARNTDLLIHDAQYKQHDYIQSKQGWGHSTPEMACDVARSCGARQLVLFHHEPRYNDEQIAEMECEAQRLFPATLAAYEGLEIVL